MIKKISDAPRVAARRYVGVEAANLISDRFDLHSISLRGNICRSERESLNVQTSS
jgi:hypothetical protein